ncbi:MAG: MobA/MobL family protein, partial [Thiolinea sp.]
AGGIGKAQPHAAYIAREGQYAHRLERGEVLEATGHGNMPAWTAHDPLQFWAAADANERKNGSTYREHELALPRELSPAQRLELVNDWISSEVGKRHVYQFAIHTPRASDGKEQPHAHLMFSERTLDGIDRDPDQFFKRYNSKQPERGGARKANTGLKAAERKVLLMAQRERWGEHCNRHLERAGLEQRIDMRSYADQGKDREPERKMLPSEWRQPQQRAKVIQFRQARKELAIARQALAQRVPHIRAQIVRLKETRLMREIAEGKQRIRQRLGIYRKEKALARERELEKQRQRDRPRRRWRSRGLER